MARMVRRVVWSSSREARIQWTHTPAHFHLVGGTSPVNCVEAVEENCQLVDRRGANCRHGLHRKDTHGDPRNRGGMIGPNAQRQGQADSN